MFSPNSIRLLMYLGEVIKDKDLDEKELEENIVRVHRRFTAMSEAEVRGHIKFLIKLAKGEDIKWK